MSLIIDNEYFQNVNDPYITVKDVLDFVNHKINNINESKIPLSKQIQIIRLVMNEYMFNNTLSAKVFSKTLVVNQQSYMLDVPNLISIKSITLDGVTLTNNFLSTVTFSETTEQDAIATGLTFFTTKKIGVYQQLTFKPIPTTASSLIVEYWSSGNEPINSINDYLQIDNALYTYFMDSAIYKFIQNINDSNDPLKRELSFYDRKHNEGLGKAKRLTGESKDSSNVFSIRYSVEELGNNYYE